MKRIFSFYVLLTTYYLYADVPGNKPRPSYDVKISGLNQYNNHVFFVQDNHVVSELTDSSKNIHVQGGYGAPKCIKVWAINKNNFVHTDTLFFCSGDSKNSKIIIVNIHNRHLSYTTDAIKGKNQNIIPFYTIRNNKDDDIQINKIKTIMYLISGLSLLILTVLMFFIRKNNKELELQRSI